jgi:hypothetical protein
MRNIALGSGIGCATMALAPLPSADTMSGTYKATVVEDDPSLRIARAHG